MRFRDRTRTTRRQGLGALQDADDFAPGVADGRALNPDRYTQAASIEAFRYRVREWRRTQRVAKHLLVSRQFVERQQAGDRLAKNLRLRKTVESFRSLVPQKYGSVESEGYDRFRGVREQCLQERLRAGVSRHLRQICPCRLGAGLDGGGDTRP